MDGNEAMFRLRSDLVALRTGGQRALSIEALQSYLAQLELEPGRSPEDRQLELQRILAHYGATNEFNLELFRTGSEAGKEALQASLLINGGAVVAVLGFLGASVGKSNANVLGFALSEPLFAFGLGVLLSAIAFGARYLTTYAQGSARWSLAIWFNRAAIGLAVLAYAVFFAGVWWAYLAFRIHFAAAP